MINIYLEFIRPSKLATILISRIRPTLLLLLCACQPFPGISVQFHQPNEGVISKTIQDNWMSVDRGIATAVQLAMHQRMKPGSNAIERSELETAGFSCEPEPSTQCSHTSTITTIPVGPTPANGIKERQYIVRVSAIAGHSTKSIGVSKKERIREQ